MNKITIIIFDQCLPIVSPNGTNFNTTWNWNSRQNFIERQQIIGVVVCGSNAELKKSLIWKWLKTTALVYYQANNGLATYHKALYTVIPPHIEL